MKCITWNLEWASPDSKRGTLIQHALGSLNVDVICYTEAIQSIIPEQHRIEADPDYGYNHSGNRRKVSLWSKSPWSEIDLIGSPNMPSGRFVSGITNGIRFIGVCIPWKDAHVKTGRKDRAPWQDHLSYCAHLKEIIEFYRKCDTPICVLGDYNQRIPRFNQPENIFQALRSSIPQDFSIPTEGILDHENNRLIDHIAISPDISVLIDQIIPRFADDGTRLSDHSGVVATIVQAY